MGIYLVSSLEQSLQLPASYHNNHCKFAAFRPQKVTDFLDV